MNIETTKKKSAIQFSKSFSTLEHCKPLFESYAIDELGFSIEKAKAFAISVVKECSFKLLSAYPDMDRFYLWYYINCIAAKAR
jgi:hypothetical protein